MVSRYQLYREEKENRENLFNFVLEKFPQVKTLVYAINPKGNDSIYDLDIQNYYGEGFLMEEMDGLQFKIGPKSFFQTNTKQGERLYQITRDFAELTGTQTVYDLYCGTGSIGIFVSKQAKKIIGVEVIKEAIDDAKVNASMNNISNILLLRGAN